MIDQTVIGEVEEDELVRVHIAWDVGRPVDENRPVRGVDTRYQAVKRFCVVDTRIRDVDAELGWIRPRAVFVSDSSKARPTLLLLLTGQVSIGP